jgi:hypothetical protein
MRSTKYSLSLFAVVFLTAVSVSAQSISADEIVSRHLNSIGTEQVRKSVKNFLVTGTSAFEAKSPIVHGAGKVIIVSDPSDLYFLMSLNSREYPFEKIGIFGDKVSIPFVTAGRRSVLGIFLNEHSRVLSDSLFCGSMSFRWISKIAELKLKASGKKNINGRAAYVIDVISRGSGSDDFTMKLFFDAETFHHIRSEYHRELQAGVPTFGRQNQYSNDTIDLKEEFSDFRESNGLTLPYKEKISLVSNSGGPGFEVSWTVSVNNYNLNQNLAADFFTFDDK